jgi:hypothetical protein
MTNQRNHNQKTLTHCLSHKNTLQQKTMDKKTTRHRKPRPHCRHKTKKINNPKAPEKKKSFIEKDKESSPI